MEWPSCQNLRCAQAHFFHSGIRPLAHRQKPTESSVHEWVRALPAVGKQNICRAGTREDSTATTCRLFYAQTSWSWSIPENDETRNARASAGAVFPPALLPANCTQTILQPI